MGGNEGVHAKDSLQIDYRYHVQCNASEQSDSHQSLPDMFNAFRGPHPSWRMHGFSIFISAPHVRSAFNRRKIALRVRTV